MLNYNCPFLVPLAYDFFVTSPIKRRDALLHTNTNLEVQVKLLGKWLASCCYHLMLLVIAAAEPPDPTPTAPEGLRVNAQNQFSALRRSERQTTVCMLLYIKSFSFEICVGLSGVHS